MERRSALKNIGGLLLAPALSFSGISTDKNPVLRVAHLTDIHLKNQFDAPARFTKCLHHIRSSNRRKWTLC